MDKIDFKRTDKPFYTAKTDRWELVDVPEWQFLSAEGQGDPQLSPAYTAAVSALYSLSYALKFRSKSVHEPRLRGRAAGGAVVGRRHAGLSRR
jgi:hypothetical protein